MAYLDYIENGGSVTERSHRNQDRKHLMSYFDVLQKIKPLGSSKDKQFFALKLNSNGDNTLPGGFTSNEIRACKTLLENLGPTEAKSKS